MKKVMILSAAALMFGLAIPEFAEATIVQSKNAIMQVKEVKYTEIKVAELPEAVNKSISEAYTGYKIDKAYMGDDGSFKAKVSMGDLKYVLFYNANGELIKMEEPAKKE